VPHDGHAMAAGTGAESGIESVVMRRANVIPRRVSRH
jgi:hypothetical protein